MFGKVKEKVDTKIVQPVKQAVALAVTSIMLALTALLLVVFR